MAAIPLEDQRRDFDRQSRCDHAGRGVLIEFRTKHKSKHLIVNHHIMHLSKPHTGEGGEFDLVESQILQPGDKLLGHL